MKCVLTSYHNVEDLQDLSQLFWRLCKAPKTSLCLLSEIVLFNIIKYYIYKILHFFFFFNFCTCNKLVFIYSGVLSMYSYLKIKKSICVLHSIGWLSWFGNSIVIFVLFKQRATLQPTDYLTLNLAISDASIAVFGYSRGILEIFNVFQDNGYLITSVWTCQV